MKSMADMADEEEQHLLEEPSSERSRQALRIRRSSWPKWICLAPTLVAMLAIAVWVKGLLQVMPKPRPRADAEALFEQFSASNISLFCFMVIQPPPSYEYDLARYLHNNSLSIFRCDAWAVFSDGWDSPIPFGTDQNNATVNTYPIPGPEAYHGSYQHEPMLINGAVLYRAWERVVDKGIYKNHTFTVKVDPDSAFVPQRLKQLLLDGGKLDSPDVPPGKFFLNCWKWSAAGTMQGPLEVLSEAALENFGKQKETCYQAGLKNQPEDHSMMNCLSMLGSWRLPLRGALYDATGCPQPDLPGWIDCRQPSWAVYHPLKGKHAWSTCWSMIQAQSSDIAV